MNKQFDIGDYIKIIKINSSLQKKKRKPYIGEISFIDIHGNLYGTWGGFIINPEIDEVEKMENRPSLDFLKNLYYNIYRK